MNLPICVVALGLGAWSVPGPRDTASSAGPRFDVAGAALVTAAGASVVLLGSSDTLARSWVWAPTLLLIAAVAVAVLLRVERRATSPLLPPRIFADPGLARSIMVTLAAGVALFGTFTFVPLAIVSGGDDRPELTGLLLLPMSAGQLAVTTGFAVLARRWPAITVWGRVGLGLGVVGLLGIASVPLLEPGLIRTGMTIAGLALSGAAFGLSMQAYTLIAQSRAPADIIGSTMATLTFSRQIGGSLGIAAFGWIALQRTGPVGLSTVFVLAALVLLIATLTAPRQSQDQPAPRAETPPTDATSRT